MVEKETKQEKPERKGIISETEEVLVRISGQDIPGSRGIYSGLTRVKGVSWSISNIICKKLNLERNKKIKDLTKEDKEKIELLLKNLEIPDFLKNRRNDFDSGENKHLIAIDLDLRKEFDIKRLKKIKSYRGLRHSLRLPSRGQRTRSNFRKSGVAVGVKRAKQGKKS